MARTPASKGGSPVDCPQRSNHEPNEDAANGVNVWGCEGVATKKLGALSQHLESQGLKNEIVGDGKGYVKGMKCDKMKLGEPDESGRRRPVR